MARSKFKDAMKAFLQAKLDEHVRPEVQALVKRGNITLEEYREFRGNSWEQEHVFTALNDEALTHAIEHNLANCFRVSSPCATYPEALSAILAPELLRRFKVTKQIADTALKLLREVEFEGIYDGRGYWPLSCHFCCAQAKLDTDEAPPHTEDCPLRSLLDMARQAGLGG